MKNSQRLLTVLLVATLVAVVQQTNSQESATTKFTSLDNGKELSFDEIIASHKGKYVLVDIWAGWCPPCRAEMPHSVKLREELPKKDIEFVYISADFNKQDWKQALEELKIEQLGSHYQGDKDKVKPFFNGMGISSIPYYLLYDRSGNLVAKKLKYPSNPELKETLLEAIKAK